MNIEWIGRAIGVSIVNSVVGDYIQNFLPNILRRGPKKQQSITGEWIAVFTLERDGVVEQYCEEIVFGQVIGTMIANERMLNSPMQNIEISNSDETVKPNEKIDARDKVSRVMGTHKHSCFYGTWFHPAPDRLDEGVYFLRVAHNNGVLEKDMVMDGNWIGNTQGKKGSKGIWRWARFDQELYCGITSTSDYMANLEKFRKFLE
jgi:hypothetical protein